MTCLGKKNAFCFLYYIIITFYIGKLFFYINCSFDLLATATETHFYGITGATKNGKEKKENICPYQKSRAVRALVDRADERPISVHRLIFVHLSERDHDRR